jgi:hypothetical protein
MPEKLGCTRIDRRQASRQTCLNNVGGEVLNAPLQLKRNERTARSSTRDGIRRRKTQQAARHPALAQHFIIRPLISCCSAKPGAQSASGCHGSDQLRSFNAGFFAASMRRFVLEPGFARALHPAHSILNSFHLP